MPPTDTATQSAPQAPALAPQAPARHRFAETNDPFSQQEFCDLRVPGALRGGARCAYELDALIQWFTRRTLHHQRLIDPVTRQEVDWDDIEAILRP